MFSFFKDKQIALILLAVVSVIIAFTYVDSHAINAIGSPRVWSPDTQTYIEAMKFIEGSSTGPLEPVVATRLLTSPLLLTSALGIKYIVGDYGYGILFLNFVLYLVSVILFYQLALQIYKQERIAFIAAFLYITNWCLFSFGTTYLSDMGGWFFFLLTSLLSVLYYLKNRSVYLYAAIAAACIGVLFKEYGALGIISLGMLIILGARTWGQKIRDILVAGVSFLLVLVAYHAWFYFQFDWSYVDWYQYNHQQYRENTYKTLGAAISTLIKVIGWVFLAGWPFFAMGVWYEIKDVLGRNYSRAILLLGLLPASLFFLVWPAFTQRVAFTLVPWVALIAAYGLSKIQKTWFLVVLLLIYALINYHVDILMIVINI